MRSERARSKGPSAPTQWWRGSTWVYRRSTWELIIFPGILVVYGLLHVAVRLALSNSAELDEAEQLLLSQAFNLGYADHPPLYTWLLIPFFALFGVGILPMALLKNLLLVATQLCLFLAARVVLKDAYLAILTSLSLWLMPQFAWESHRDLTHSVLVTSLSAGVYYGLVALPHPAKRWYYLVLGVLLGLGTLSKPNFLLFAVALLTAAASQRQMRGLFFTRQIILTLVLTGLIALPHSWWMLNHFHGEIAQTVEAIRWRSSQPVSAVATGLFELVSASLRFVTPLWCVYALLFPQMFRPSVKPTPALHAHSQLLERFFLMVFASLAGGVILLGETNFKDRWMQPFLFLVPLYAFLRLQRVGVEIVRLRKFAYVSAIAGLLVLAALMAQAWIGPRFGVYSRLHVPFPHLAEKIRQAGFRHGTVVADKVFIGGNLRLAFTASRVVTPENTTGMLTAPSEVGQCLIVWNGHEHEGLPDGLRHFVEATWHVPFPRDPPTHYVEAPVRHALGQAHQPMFRLGFILFPNGLGDCR